jgi:hypothetical protein
MTLMDHLNGNTTGTGGYSSMSGKSGGFGPPGISGAPGGVPGGGPAVKVPNNYIVDTSSVVNAISSLMSANATHVAQVTDKIGTIITWIDSGHTNNLTKLNDEMVKLNTISTNGYTEMLRRTDVTNTLLDTLIGVTNDVSAKPINISGKRVNDVMTNVKNRVYGITGA